MSAILLVDDDREVLEINKRYLEQEGFCVHAFSSPPAALQHAKQTPPDCVILDVMMPKLYGFTFCYRLRAFSSFPVIFLTGKGSEDDKIDGLTTGADDYIVKPYSLRELKARIDVQLRRAAFQPSAPESGQLVCGSLTIDRLNHKALFRGADLGLANREYEVLLYLASHPNREITFAELGTALFGTYQEADRRSVMVNVSRLRKKLSVDPELENRLETVWSKGYRFLLR